MISVGELRLGNLFIERETQEVIHVTGLHKDQIRFSGKFDQGWQAEPIPLTKELLVKFGCVKDGLEYTIDINGEEYVISHYGSVNGSEKGFVIDYDFKDRRVQYVHHFQNRMFDKTGIELTIK